MGETPKFVNVTMVRENLEGFPACDLPAGYSFRMYRPGDEADFERVWLEADSFCQAREGLFEEQFAKQIEVVPERMMFLLDEGSRAVGTVTAWFNDDFEGARWGVVHWVAVVEGRQGRGLARPLLSQCLRRLKALGHEHVCLITQTVRLPAINLYLSFGFEPFVRTDDDRANWRKIHEALAAIER